MNTMQQTDAPLPSEDASEKKRYPSGVTVVLQPEEKQLTLHKVRTVRAVLAALNLRPGMALVVKNGELLTPDRAVRSGDTLLVRIVMSSG